MTPLTPLPLKTQNVLTFNVLSNFIGIVHLLHKIIVAIGI